jgi:DUF2075 family protein/DNA replication protein DnaC
MIVYSATKQQFQADVLGNDIENIILDAFKKATGNKVAPAEIRSWANSLQNMERVLSTDDIASDAGIAIEFHIPRSCKRIDFIVTGRDAENRDSVVLIELKQWETAGITELDAVVTTRLGQGIRETIHPSYQAWSYKTMLEDYNATVEEEQIRLHPCAYLHNYRPDEVIRNVHYSEHIERAPVFLKPDAQLLRTFIGDRIHRGDDSRIMHRIERGKIRPSKSLADHIAQMLAGNPEFVMIDDQKVAYETAMRLAQSASPSHKKVLVIQGGPGTGKSVLAINLLVALTTREHNVRYVTRNSAPRMVYEAKLAGSMRKTRIAEMFSGSGSFHSLERSAYDTLIVDEAHRLNAKSGMYKNLGENQIMEIIEASNCAIFFLDEDQRVTLEDIGDMEQIRTFADKAGAEVVELQLESQFRCNGSDGYLAWLDDTLQIRETANTDLIDIDYDFQIFDDPAVMHAVIKEKNAEKNKARMVAGYCWEWISKKNPALKDIHIGSYAATWNLDEHGQAWIIQPDSVDEVGCIHTSQGLEIDYVGVIVGPDFVVREGTVITDPSKRAKADKSVFGWKKRARQDAAATAVHTDRIIKNTYRTLMTRGQKGCYVYFTDQETREYFKSRLILN